jgi:hypothetical protein
LPSSAEWNSSRHAVALHRMDYNFCRIHKTLEVTPVMEGELTDQVCDLEEIIALLEPSAV